MGKALPTATNNFNSNSALHPPYFEMISDAISTLKHRNGSSQEAISKLIEEKYKESLPPTFRKTLCVQIKKLVRSERLIEVNNSFKISPAEKQTEEGEKRKGGKTKRLSQVRTPEGKKPASAAAVGGKMKRLSQVRTPEGFKRKRDLDLGKLPTASGNGKEQKKRRK